MLDLLAYAVKYSEAKLFCYMSGVLGERRYNSYSFLTSALEGGDVVIVKPQLCFTPGKGPAGTHWIGC
jgi:hypothetical protein